MKISNRAPLLGSIGTAAVIVGVLSITAFSDSPDLLRKGHDAHLWQARTVAEHLDDGRGIDSAAAAVIGREYFLKEFGLCGYPSEPIDGGHEWLLTPFVGYALQPSRSMIQIDKRTGMVSCSGHPTAAARDLVLSGITRLERRARERQR